MKSVFSKRIIETHDLDREIDEFFEFIDGEIVAHDEPEGYEGGYTMKDGEYTEKELGGRIINVKTNKDSKYYISYKSFYINKNNEDYLGVNYIIITNQTNNREDKQIIIGN